MAHSCCCCCCCCYMADKEALSPIWFQLRKADTVPTKADGQLCSSFDEHLWDSYKLPLAGQRPPQALSLESSVACSDPGEMTGISVTF